MAVSYFSPQTAKESGVLRRTADAILSSAVRFRVSLGQFYLDSTLRLLVLEIRAFPLRILALRQFPLLRLGNTLSAVAWDQGIGNFGQENKYALACMSRIQELRRTHPWVTPLDLEIASHMHRWGAIWYRDNFQSGIETRDTESVNQSQSLSTPV